MNALDKLINIDKINDISITGTTNEFFGVYVYNLLKQKQKNILIVTSTLFEANTIYGTLSNFTDNVYLFPMDDFLTSQAIAISPDLLINRMETLKSISDESCNIVITNLMGYLRFLPTLSVYQSKIVDLKVNFEISPRKLYNKLLDAGYVSETLVTKTGEVGLRGYVIDIFPLGEDYPCRVEFFGDTVESIRIFDPATQKSIKNISSIQVYPYSEFLVDKELDVGLEKKQNYLPLYSQTISNIGDYLDNPIVIYKDLQQIESSYKLMVDEITNYREDKDKDFVGNYMFAMDELHFNNVIQYMSINNINVNKNISCINFNVIPLTNFYENSDLINNTIYGYLNDGKTVIICVKSYQIKSLIKMLTMKVVETDINNILENTVNIVNFEMNGGFCYKNYVFITGNELFKEKIHHNKYKTNFKYSSKIYDINKLNIGDFVVHNVHGIGIYNGVKKISLNNLDKDYLEVIYQGKDKLYIPVEKIDSLYKYSGKEGIVPKINKLGGTEWQKTKLRVNKKIADMATELIKVHAEREQKKGFSFSSDSALQLEFENTFPHTLTSDQIRAINQIKNDMESLTPMDRLLCGDVGFGKTEVAFVAAFKAILDSKQVFFLCPTTILSKQHYDNALERFKNFPVSIALLNRFTSSSDVKRILDEIKMGTVDLVIGTHRLLSDDVVPHDLGLLVIDEEQRFGVRHKEKIKQIKNNIDVLTLTATPIPRTLQMSMAGLRSLSLIETPPVDRYPVQTYVIEENNQIIRDAVYKELSRGGQVFVLFNEVSKIEKKVLELQQLIPEASIIYAHGQMNKVELETRMLSFINKEYDILVCTTIIETGIDIPNVNTLIILDSDKFGLSQLYQIRGRVGRSNKFAYAYLMYSPNKTLTETSIKRLNVIKEFTELGSGFSIATRDLSIRGAGDILGSEQAGFIDSVGIDLYLKMLNDEIRRRNGNIYYNMDSDDDVSQPLLDVSTHIKDSYVLDQNLKIEIHKKINTISSRETFINVKNELEDRFGTLDEEMIIYMYEEWFEKLAKKVPLLNLRQTKNSIELIFSKKISNYIAMDSLLEGSIKITNMFRFLTRGDNIVIVLDIIKLDKHPVFYLVDLLLLISENNA